MNIVELALTTYTESKAMEAEEAGDRFERERDEFMKRARGCASSTLSEDAGDLDWQYTPAASLPDSVEEARALLAPGRLEYLRYRADYADEDNMSVAFELVQPCLACGHDRITEVTGLFHLGQILSQPEDQRPTAGEGEGLAAPGPLAGIDALQARADRVTRLARNLVAEHPDASLTVRFATVVGHQDGGNRAELQLRAASVGAAAAVAKALGTELVTQISSTIPAYVFRRGDVTVTVDGIEVQLSAHTRLTDDEAAAWRAEQPQAAEDGDR